MSLELWLAFVAAAVMLLIVPGPTITLVISHALAEGRRVALASVAGVVLGDVTAVTLSIAGLGAILATSATLFAVLKWLGVAYLVWLGVRLWRRAGTIASEDPGAGAGDSAAARRSRRSVFGHTYAVTALNPKGIAFFMAFVPQFVDPATPALTQMAIMGATFVVLAAINATLYAMLAARMRATFSGPRIRRGLERLGGGMLIGAGFATAAWQRAG